jgi:hypothetical protein
MHLLTGGYFADEQLMGGAVGIYSLASDAERRIPLSVDRALSAPALAIALHHRQEAA